MEVAREIPTYFIFLRKSIKRAFIIDGKELKYRRCFIFFAQERTSIIDNSQTLLQLNSSRSGQFAAKWAMPEKEGVKTEELLCNCQLQCYTQLCTSYTPILTEWQWYNYNVLTTKGILAFLVLVLAARTTGINQNVLLAYLSL